MPRFFLSKVVRQGAPLLVDANGIVTTWDTTTRRNRWSAALSKYPVTFVLRERLDFDDQGVPQGREWGLCICGDNLLGVGAAVRLAIRNDPLIISLPTDPTRMLDATERSELDGRLAQTDLADVLSQAGETPRGYAVRLVRDVFGKPPQALITLERD